MPLSDLLTNRLFNWKFQQAVQYIDDSVPREQQALIRALARRYGNSGYFNGPEAVIVAAAVKTLLGNLSGWEPSEEGDDNA